MSAQDVYRAITSAGVRCARTCWPKGSAPALPWAVYLLDSDAPVSADDSRYAECRRWRVELYQRGRDAALEAALLSAISESFGPYSLSESWVESEGCDMLSVVFTDYDEGSQNG